MVTVTSGSAATSHVPRCVGLPARARTLRKSACGIHDRTCNRTEDRAPRAQGLYTAGARLVLRATVRVVISGERLGEFARPVLLLPFVLVGTVCDCVCDHVAMRMPSIHRKFSQFTPQTRTKMAAPRVQAENASTPK